MVKGTFLVAGAVALAHNSEMYGIATVCLRAKDLVPPSTKRAIGRPRG